MTIVQGLLFLDPALILPHLHNFKSTTVYNCLARHCFVVIVLVCIFRCVRASLPIIFVELIGDALYCIVPIEIQLLCLHLLYKRVYLPIYSLTICHARSLNQLYIYIATMRGVPCCHSCCPRCLPASHHAGIRFQTDLCINFQAQYILTGQHRVPPYSGHRNLLDNTSLNKPTLVP